MVPVKVAVGCPASVPQGSAKARKRHPMTHTTCGRQVEEQDLLIRLEYRPPRCHQFIDDGFPMGKWKI